MSTRRRQRVNEFIKREVSLLFQREIRDPRIGFITVMRCDIAPNLRDARIYVSVLGDKRKKEEAMAGLQSATPYIQGKIGKIINLRYAPKVTFFLDESTEKAIRIEELLGNIKKDEQPGA